MIHPPLALIAELTHRCPLKCLYCSNPLELVTREQELTTEDWSRIIDQAAALGVTQISLTGGEPCLRADLDQIVSAASKKNLYINLITSGVGLSEDSLASLVHGGVQNIQLSFQDSRREGAQWVSGVDALERKQMVAEWILKFPVAFTVNIVVHRRNHERLREMIEMAVTLGASKVEVAYVQFHGWALKNRSQLLPTRDQVVESMKIIREMQQSLLGQVRIDYVLPDYYATTPKACMGGWAKKMLLIDPMGLAAPCHSASTLKEWNRPSVREMDLTEIWYDSPLFNAFRGDQWMPETCRQCDKKEVDFGGCRCQALAITGNASSMDPVCVKSPDRHLIDEAINMDKTDNHSHSTYRALSDRRV